MMPVPQEGMNVDPDILIQTQSNFIAQARVKEVQMEAAIQQLLAENQVMSDQIESLMQQVPEVELAQE